MPRTEITERTLYQFGELSDKAKARAIEDRRQIEYEDFDHEYIYEDFQEIARILGIELGMRERRRANGEILRDRPKIWYSGFSSQGDGACFEGRYAYADDAHRAVREHAPQDAELHRIADELHTIQQAYSCSLTATITHTGRYYHSRSVDIDVDGDRNLPDKACKMVSEALRDLMDWLYKSLQAEYDYRTGDDAIAEYLKDSDDEYTADGKRA